MDDYGLITVIIKKEVDNLTSFFLRTPKKVLETKIISKTDLQEFNKYEITYDKDILLYEKNQLTQGTSKCIIKTGKIVRTERFDEEFKYDKLDLGITYYKDRTIIKVWSPVAKAVQMVYFLKNEAKNKVDLKYQKQGVWVAEVLGDLDNYLYYINIRLTSMYIKTLDPYAIASIENNECNTIVNPKTLYDVKHKHIDFSGKPTDAVIYEAHVRDMTILTNNMHKGQFLGMMEEVNPILSIKDLGFTHLQLLPINDYHEVDELNPKAYNWGYNPAQYSVLEGSYSSNPRNPKTRINEFRRVVDYAHEKGLGIILDVVFNHVYLETIFPFNTLVPGYYYHYDKKGIKTTNSMLDNDIASTKNMVRQFILQTIKFYLEFYHVDGFRFDLMGLLDTTTMNEVYNLVKRINYKSLVYGEGWNMASEVCENYRANMANEAMMEVGHFNDYFREKAFEIVLSENPLQSDLSDMFFGSSFMFSNPNKSINYLTCHDGYTLYDRLTLSIKEGSNLMDKVRIVFALTILSQGVPFIQGGDEFLRTKKYNSNSYNSGDLINGFDYSLLDESNGLRKYIKQLIDLRKRSKVFKMESYDEMKQNIHCIKDYYYLLKDDTREYYIYFKLKRDEETLHFDFEVAMIFDGYQQTKKNLKYIDLNQIGVYVFIKE